MSGMTFTASMQIAIEWVNRNLLYPEDRTIRPIPRQVGFVWFTKIQADREWCNRAEDRPNLQTVYREINFFVGEQKMIIMTLEGLRHFYPISNRRTWTEWSPARIWYRTDWTALELHDEDVHKEEIFYPTWVDVSSTYAPEG